MANTNITIRIDEKLKSDLQELLEKLGLDMTTFFIMTAKQAVREQAIPFHPNLNTGIYSEKSYEFAKNDEWLNEKEWDDLYKELNQKK